MNQPFSIERVVEKNFHEFIRLIVKFAQYEHLTPPDEGAQERLKKDGLSGDPSFEAYLGTLDGGAVGFITMFQTYSTFMARPLLYLEDIFVLEDFRKSGIGQKFFDFYVQEAKNRGDGGAQWCVLDWNEPAIRFYEKNRATRKNWIFYGMDQQQIEDHLSD